MSLPEILIWQRLKGSPQGIRFRKQHPIGDYRPDFYCAARKLVIEVDGIAHDMGDRPERDELRTERLQALGYEVLRIGAADVLKDADEVAQSIIDHIRSSPRAGRGTAGEAGGGGGSQRTQTYAEDPLHRASGAVPLPMNGEDL